MNNTITPDPTKPRRHQRPRLPVTVSRWRTSFAAEESFVLRIHTRPAKDVFGAALPSSCVGVLLPRTIAEMLRDALGRALDRHEAETSTNDTDEVTTHAGEFDL